VVFHPTLNKWYLDDGSIVAPLPAIPSLLHSISSLSQQVGLRLNLSKCVLLHGPGITSIPPGLQSLQLRDWSDNGTKVLGTPIGSQRYTLQLLTEKFDECKFLADRILQLPHLQMAWRLLTHCSGFCKVNFLLRVVPYLWGQAFAESVAGYTRLCIQKLIGSIMSTQNWTVASLPISMGGMGVQDPMWIHPSAYVSASLNYAYNVSNNSVDANLPPDFFDALQDLVDGLTPSSSPATSWLMSRSCSEVLPEQLKQKWWSNLQYVFQFQGLLSSVSLRDKVQLQCQKSSLTGAWLNVVPNAHLGLTIPCSEFKCLLRWRMGISLLPVQGAGSPCVDCGKPLDIYGDHFVCCRYCGFWSRHSIALAAGLGVQLELSIPSKKRPADLLIRGLEEEPLALDVSIIHPAPPSSRPTFDAVSLRETHKFQKYSDSCTVLGWLFRPFCLSTFGEFGPCASDIITRLALLLTTSPQSFPIVRQRITQSISVALMKVVGFQLVCGLHSYLCEAGDDTVLE